MTRRHHTHILSDNPQSVQAGSSVAPGTVTRAPASLEFLAALDALDGRNVVAVRDQIRRWCADRYADGLRDGKDAGRREAVSSFWQLDPDAAEVAQEISDMLPPLPAIERHRLDRAPADLLRPKGLAA